ncbi:MAG: xylulokinase [Chloroflexota bacterium]|nr:xylulokinase [Chloroflexota bacterium]
MPLLLGIDIGTSSIKAILFQSETAAIVASAGHEYPTHRPAADRAEQDPADWWTGVVEVVSKVTADARTDEIAGIGLCGHMHGVAFLDRVGRAVRPAIIWADQRSGTECHDLIDQIGAERFASIAGTLPAAGFAAPSLLWLNRHEPRTLERTATLLPPKDSVRFMMTGEIATDASDAAATALFDVSVKSWSPEIVNAVGVARSMLPPIRDSASICGSLTRAAAEQLGLPIGIPVVTGCADQPAQAFANGLIATGKASVTVGSGGQIFVPVMPVQEGARFHLPTDPRVHVFNHALPGMWYVLGATLSAGLSMRWLRDLMGMTADADAYARFSDEASAIPPGAGGLLFLPYLTGERTPHFDPGARGAFIGLSASHTRGHLARAIMEGVAFSLREALTIGMNIGGSVSSVIAAGGAMDSPTWRQIVADVLGLPLRQTGLSETTAIGAALLAGVGVGVYDTYTEACTRTSRAVRITEPNDAAHARYNAIYPVYLGLYGRLREDMHALGGL